MTSTTTSPEQLTLLPDTTVPVRFRLDEATRRRGLAHVAEIKARLQQVSEAKAAARAGLEPQRRLRLTPTVSEAPTELDAPVSIAPADAGQHAA